MERRVPVLRSPCITRSLPAATRFLDCSHRSCDESISRMKITPSRSESSPASMRTGSFELSTGNSPNTQFIQDVTSSLLCSPDSACSVNISPQQTLKCQPHQALDKKVLEGQPDFPTRRALFEALDDVAKSTDHEPTWEKSMPSTSSWMAVMPRGRQMTQGDLGIGRDSLLLRAHSWCTSPTVAMTHESHCGQVNAVMSPERNDSESIAFQKLHHSQHLMSKSLTLFDGPSTPSSSGTLLQASPCCVYDSPGNPLSGDTGNCKDRNELNTITAIPPLPFQNLGNDSDANRQSLFTELRPENVPTIDFRKCTSLHQRTLIGIAPSSTCPFECTFELDMGLNSPSQSDIEAALDSMPTPPRSTAVFALTPGALEASFSHTYDNSAFSTPESNMWTDTWLGRCHATSSFSHPSRSKATRTQHVIEQPLTNTYVRKLFASEDTAAVRTPVSDHHPAECTRDAWSWCSSGMLGTTQGYATPDAVANPHRRKASSLAAARDRFKKSVGALKRSSEFRSARLQELDAMSSPGCKGDAYKEQHSQVG